MANNNNNKIEKTQQELLSERKSGKLPVIDIAGHPFYVDVRMETLRPHDDFSTTGIPFSVFIDFAVSDDFAWIPYDPQKHQVKHINPFKLTAIPEDWMIVEIPPFWKLDPYGYAREKELNIEAHLKEYPMQEDMKARIVPWNETNIPEVIERNKKKQQIERKRIHNHSATAVEGKKQRRKR